MADNAHKAVEQREEQQVLRQDDQTADVEALLVPVIELWVVGASEHVVPQQVGLDKDKDDRVLPVFLKCVPETNKQ